MAGENTNSVTVIGAGVAGLAASCALSGAGYQVELLERRPFVGGRASSYEHPSLREVVDCQHVLLGCCTNLIHLVEAIGVGEQIRWYDELVFVEQGGRRSSFRANGLPAPLHFSRAFAAASMLGVSDKLAIARGMTDFVANKAADDNTSVEAWLRRTGQTERAIRHFWEPVVLCTLNDSFANCSLRVTGKVFRELFLKSAHGARLGIPTVPLTDFYSAAVRLLEARGGKVCYRTGVESLSQESTGGWTLHTTAGTRRASRVVLALPFEQTRKLITGLPVSGDSLALDRDVESFVHAPYTTVHLWFDRQITDLHHAALLDATVQWIFHKSKIRSYTEEQGSYVELVIAASTAQLKLDRSVILERALAELAGFFPEVKQAKLVKSGILKEARATFSVLPGLHQRRPNSRSPWRGLYLAGDWTATDWPSTMESAARSGYLAAEAITEEHGQPQRFLQADLPAEGAMRFFG